MCTPPQISCSLCILQALQACCERTRAIEERTAQLVVTAGWRLQRARFFRHRRSGCASAVATACDSLPGGGNIPPRPPSVPASAAPATGRALPGLAATLLPPNAVNLQGRSCHEGACGSGGAPRAAIASLAPCWAKPDGSSVQTSVSCRRRPRAPCTLALPSAAANAVPSLLGRPRSRKRCAAMRATAAVHTLGTRQRCGAAVKADARHYYADAWCYSRHERPAVHINNLAP